MDIELKLADEFKIKQWQVKNLIELIDGGNTIPFIARYRKEAHGSLDDQVLREISERLEYLRNLEKRRQEVFDSIDSQGKMTEEIENALQNAQTLAEIEDVYRPYKQKRRTRASVAKEKGLEPLALKIFAQEADSLSPEEYAPEFINEELGVMNAEEALAGASDIIAEMISDNANIRKRLKNLFMVVGEVKSVKARDEESVYEKYYDYSEPVPKITGHRIQAINRGEREGFLKVSVNLDVAKAMNVIASETLLNNGSACTEFVRQAGADAYDRLIYPSVQNEIRGVLTGDASTNSIKVFASNLRELLMQPPVKGFRVLGLDPAYRTGCKVAVVDETGRVLDTSVIYPVPPHNKKEDAKKILRALIKKHGVGVIAIGNGTASKETEIFASELIKELDEDVKYMMVNEAGASVYSASKLAAEEFPQFDVSLRSAVSIARRLQDPLAELVKIDPKSIGVGQYQHDVPQNQLENALTGVVEDCVNSVGVDLNTASASLLSRVAGINSSVAKNIVVFREENGGFKSRAQIKKVPKLGPKAFEQCAGFLRIPESVNVFDNTSVHPESYEKASALLKLCGLTEEDVKKKRAEKLRENVEKMGEENVASKLAIGVPTLSDIIDSIMKPGRDPRDELPAPMLRTDVLDINDLKEGMIVKGTVRNVVDFGAFIDIGVHQDGLVHISQIADRFIKHPSEVLSVGDIVDVRILEVDVQKNRISLSMKTPKASAVGS